jgi:MFS family permease
VSETIKKFTHENTEKALNKMVKQGVTVQVKASLTQSAFLVGFALLLGAPNTVIGILAAIPFITQFLQMPSVILIEKYKNRRKLNFITQLGNRIGILLLALIPFISTSEIGIILLIGIIAIQAIFQAVGSPAWNSWLRDLVPKDKLGSFFARRMALMGIMGVITSIVGGVFIGEWTRNNPDNIALGYSAIFSIAFLAGMIAIYYTVTTPEPPMITDYEKLDGSTLMAKPFQNENYKNLMWFSAIWSFSTGLAAPFFTVYLLVRLGVEFTIVAMLVALSQLTSVVFFRFWGRMVDRFSNKSMLRIAVPIFVFGTLLWTYTSIAEDYDLILPLLILIHILTGFSTAGVNLASNNIGLKLSPRGQSSIYLAARAVVIAVTGTIAPIVAGVMGDYFAQYELSFSINWIGPHGTLIVDTYRLIGLDFVFILSVLLGAYAFYRLAFVKEKGEVEDRIVIEAIWAETRRSVKTISAVDGLLNIFQVPIKATRRAVKRRRKKKKPEQETPVDRNYTNHVNESKGQK